MTDQSHICSRVHGYPLGKSVKAIADLRPFLVELDRDAVRWTTRYRCIECGALWLEAYEPTGRGEAPRVTRLEPPPPETPAA